ncbi:hypothetical protein MAP00_004954 [Monascus purpureus]|nr:hypothetical protein MAP00_004954 [Monascus purpureus]
MDMNHLIGQRFNLISKSDIRYVGTLHEINPEASTIALENVVSFGTEGRRGNPAEEIPPSASVYEYIVFRGSDVKDISVAEDTKENAQPEPPQVPDDPAILGSASRPGPPQGIPHSQPPPQPQVPRQSPSGYPQPQFQGFYPPYGQRFGPPAFPSGPGFPNMPYGIPPGWFPPPGQGFPQGPGQFPPPHMPVGFGQQQPPRPGPPGVGPAVSSKPAAELPIGEKTSSKPASRNVTPAPAPVTQSAPPPPVETKPSAPEAVQPPATAAAGGPPGINVPQQTAPPANTAATAAAAAAVVPSTPAKVPPTGPRSDRIPPAIPIATPVKPAAANNSVTGTPNNVAQGTASNAITEATRAATAAVAAAMAKLPQPSSQQKPSRTDAAVEVATKKLSEMKPFDNNRTQRGGYQNRGGRGGHRNQYQGAKKVEVPNTDYDFESANAKFNKQDLVKEAIASGSPMAENQEHVQHKVEAAAPSTNGTAPQTTTVNSYNKATSFFDNISSEARDREEGTGGRPGGREWRGEEEKRNIETFGQGSVDGYRNYRGRGRGRGYGGPRSRGGYNRGYNARGRGGTRGGRNASQSTGAPTQS